jgi:hypothetical protein
MNPFEISDPRAATVLYAAIIAATTSLISIIMQIIFKATDRKEKKSSNVFEKRQEALLLALQAIDHTYANTAFDDKQESREHEWDITIARDAMNKIIIYCKNPERTVTAFLDAMGVHNPEIESPKIYGPEQLDKFRNIICDELDLPRLSRCNKNHQWIVSLPGAKQLT